MKGISIQKFAFLLQVEKHQQTETDPLSGKPLVKPLEHDGTGTDTQTMAEKKNYSAYARSKE